MKFRSHIYKYLVKYLVPEFIKRRRREKWIRVYPIIKNAQDLFPVLCKLTDDSWDDMLYPPLYGHSKEQCLQVYVPALYAYEINNAVINCNSDVVITDYGVYWDKYNEEEFTTWAKPADSNVLWYNRENIGIRLEKNTQKISGKVLSLMGTYCSNWSHFLSQYICKLYLAGENNLLNENVTILYYNKSEDSCIDQFIIDYLKRYPLVSIKKAEQSIDYVCEKLISIPATAANFNDYHFRLDYPYLVPNFVLERVEKYIIQPYTERIKARPTKHEKIFLIRKGNFRNLINYNEIHDFFQTMGFYDIDGSALTIEQKADIFYHAKEIVGVFGGANQNLMFCNGARCMLFTNYHFVTQSWSYTYAHKKVACWINVTGIDETADYHSGFTVPLEKVKKVYEENIKN